MADLTNTIIDGDPYGDHEGSSSIGFNPNDLSTSTQTPVDSNEFITANNGNWVRKSMSKLWDYIHGKLTVFAGASSNANGTQGEVPAPLAGDQDKYLRGSGNWSQDVSALIAAFTSSDTGPTNDTVTGNGFTSVSAMTSGDSIARQFDKLSRMFYNIRKTANSTIDVYNRLNYFTNANKWCERYTGNLNDIAENSIYNTVDAANQPMNQWGFTITMIHNYGTTFGVQIWLSMQNPDTRVFVRTKIGGTWYGWSELVTNYTETHNPSAPKYPLSNFFNATNVNFKRRGCIVNFKITFSVAGGCSANTRYTLFNLPSNFRPIYPTVYKNEFFELWDGELNYPTNSNGIYTILLKTNGDVVFASSVAISSDNNKHWVYAFGTYFV